MSRDISIQVVRLAVDHCRKKGIAVEPLLAGLGFSAADLHDRSRFISWEDCVQFAERLCAALGGPEACEAWGAEAVESHPAVRVVGSLVLGLRSFYVVMVERVCRPYYPCLGVRAEVLPDGRIYLASAIPSSRRGCHPIFRASLAAYRAYPRLMGLPDAVMEAESSSHHLRCWITPPPEQHLVAKARRLVQGRLGRKAQAFGAEEGETLEAFATSLTFDERPLFAEAAAVGGRLARSPSLERMGEELWQHLHERCCASHLALWLDGLDGKAGQLVGAYGTAQGTLVSRPLYLGPTPIGHLDTDLGVLSERDGSPYLEALLPWIGTVLYQHAELERRSLRQGLPARGTDAAGMARALANRSDLSARETEVLERLCWGESNKEVAQSLAISPRTVEIHVSRVLAKLGATSRSELIARCWSTRSSSSAPPVLATRVVHQQNRAAPKASQAKATATAHSAPVGGLSPRRSSEGYTTTTGGRRSRSTAHWRHGREG